MGGTMEAERALKQHHNTAFYPHDLRHIKTLFLRRKYRQCINASREALHAVNDDEQQHLARKTFICFYLGLAHDEFARALHENSQAKLPAFDQAEQHYREAIDAMPFIQLYRTALSPIKNDHRPDTLSTSEFQLFESAPERQYSSLRLSPTIPSSPPSGGDDTSENDIPGRSTSGNEATASDSSDLSSHDSFNEIVTPHKILKRDVSRMSLLERPLQRDYSSMSLLDVRPGLVKSTSQGLLRPIRPGSPPKQYHVPPKLPYVGRDHSRGQTPTIPATQTPESPTRRPRLRLPSHEVSPVSPLGSEGITSDMSAISPVSLQTPGQQDLPESDAGTLEPDVSQLEEHLEAMHIQLQTHLRLVQRARLATTIAQAERAARSAPTVGTPLGIISNRSGVFGSHGSNSKRSTDLKSAPNNRLSQSRSFWSFTPVDVKASDKQRRIEAGRARG